MNVITSRTSLYPISHLCLEIWHYYLLLVVVYGWVQWHDHPPGKRSYWTERWDDRVVGLVRSSSDKIVSHNHLRSCLLLQPSGCTDGKQRSIHQNSSLPVSEIKETLMKVWTLTPQTWFCERLRLKLFVHFPTHFITNRSFVAHLWLFCRLPVNQCTRVIRTLYLLVLSDMTTLLRQFHVLLNIATSVNGPVSDITTEFNTTSSLSTKISL